MQTWEISTEIENSLAWHKISMIMIATMLASVTEWNHELNKRNVDGKKCAEKATCIWQQTSPYYRDRRYLCYYPETRTNKCTSTGNWNITEEPAVQQRAEMETPAVPAAAAMCLAMLWSSWCLRLFITVSLQPCWTLDLVSSPSSEASPSIFLMLGWRLSLYQNIVNRRNTST